MTGSSADIDLGKRMVTVRKDVARNHLELVPPMSDLLRGILCARRRNRPVVGGPRTAT